MDDSTRKIDTLCIGRIITEYISDQLADEIENVQSWKSCIGGSAANVALGLAKLNCPVGFIGCVGGDEAGTQLSDTLKVAGVNTVGLRTVGDAQTGWLWTLRHLDGHRTFHQPQVPFEFFADSLLSKFDINPDWFSNLGFLVPQSSHLGPEASREALFYAQELALKTGGVVLFDVNFRKFAWPDLTTAQRVIRDYARKSQILKLDLEESKLIFNVDSVLNLAGLFPDAQGILLTKGAQSCDYIIGGSMGKVPGYPVALVDSTGAGDTFVAAFLSRLVRYGMSSLLDNQFTEESVKFACVAGAVCVSRIGAADSLPTFEDIEAMLAGPPLEVA